MNLGPWGNLKHVAFADPEAALTLLKRLLQSPDTREDLMFLRSPEPVLEQDFPDFPQYWEPQTELDYSVTITDALRERLMTVLGETFMSSDSKNSTSNSNSTSSEQPIDTAPTPLVEQILKPFDTRTAHGRHRAEYCLPRSSHQHE